MFSTCSSQSEDNEKSDFSAHFSSPPKRNSTPGESSRARSAAIRAIRSFFMRWEGRE